MATGRRIYSFPGGVLEANAYGDDDSGGVYLEHYRHSADNDHYDQRADMRYKPNCLGYLRTDVSGVSQLWDESCIRKLASRLGYDFSGMIVYDPTNERPPLARLKAQVTRLDAEAVVVPSPAHFEGGEIPGTLVRQVDVITVSPEATYAWRAMPPLRGVTDLPPAQADGA
ncbi:hypothetical protein [Nocardia sp. CC227C]|uniref:hypothetical protein n=1 Tax=Nocardia sp. CC227C TaxID=3044562 RepID=UPI00278BAEEF|nr:hypothetical protein [Nocardia sp. CC227C]